MKGLRARAAALWRALRAVSGDDAYERYCAHHAAHHGGAPLSRRAFCAEELRRKWSGVSRCC
jgi:uncharacterized short protein YbdD (DUF466 family)